MAFLKHFFFFSILVWTGLLPIRYVAAQTETADKTLIMKIEVKGNERLGVEAVLQYVSTKPGDLLSKPRIRDDLKSLYNSGLFKDISIDAEKDGSGVKIIIKVVEKDFIQDLRYSGHKEVNKEDLDKAVNLKVPFLWDESIVKNALEKIRKLYKDKGFYLITVRTEVLQEDKKKILKFEIDEGDRVEVKRIYFQGNTVFSDETLKEAMVTKEGGFWSSVSGSGRFDEEVLTQVDSRRIQLQYWKNGYAFAKVDQPSITFTPDRRQVFVSYHIEEGEKYDVGEITFSGDLDFIPKPEELKETLNSQKGEVWNYLKIQEDLQKIQDIYGDEGYAYANVTPEWKVNADDRHRLDIDFRIDKGSIVYFGSVEVQGNKETYDRVIRRELEFREGELYNVSRFRESKQNLEKLGYFSSVKFIQKDILAEKRMDITIEVEEKQTGTLTLGASFSSFDRFGIQGAVSKVNLFGRGYDINLSGLFSGKRQTFQASFTNPRVYDSRFSLSLQAYNSEFQSVDDTEVKERGGSVTVGYPIAKNWTLSGTYGIQDIDINIQEIIQKLFRNSTGLASSMTATLTRDTLNTREIFLPSKGTLNSVSTTVASRYLGSDLSYWKTAVTSKRYLQVFDEDSMIFPASVLSFAVRGEYLRGIEGRSTPFNERFVPGGIYSIRGHPYRSLGPSMNVPFSLTGRRADDHLVDLSEPRSLKLGGNKQIIGNVEYLFDIFREAKIKGVIFLDGGNTFAENNWDWSELRASTGFGFRWFSPLGPLRFEWGIPLDRRKGEDAVLFDFSIGSPF